MPRQGHRGGWIAASVGAMLACAALIPALAFGHLERPSYWPDPDPETVEGVDVGGAVPKAKSLGSALSARGPSELHVACQGKDGARSLKALKRSIRRASDGWRLRPSQPKQKLSDKRAERLERLNEKFARECEYRSVQDAVSAADNHDRVVIMPGTYKEPKSRRAPVNDPKCAEMTQTDQSGAETPSYRYQTECPNDQNLIYVQGREVPPEPPPSPPLEDRQGIPDLGPCLRCGLQIEGSGVRPEDIILDGGANYDRKSPAARPEILLKHVVLRIDRADGIVVRNLLARGAKEHGIYVEEVDGYRLDRTKFYWAADYGNLTFTSDHGLYKNCDGFGAGDAVVYPGAAPETGEQADKSFYTDAPRINTTVTKCDLHGSVLAYSGSMGNAVRITGNHIYGNTAGISSDTISAPGHPGYPSDSLQVDNNYIYSNNLNVYTESSEIEPLIPMPIGSGIVLPGMNSARVHDNWIWDNWRHGALLAAVPDAVSGDPDGRVHPGPACQSMSSLTSSIALTSCGNRFFNNHMGQVPPDFDPHHAMDDFGNVHSSGLHTTGAPPEPGGTSTLVQPNGVDFWWDEFPGNEGNCWYDNTGPDGTAASVTGSGRGAPPDPLPSNCDTSTGNGDPVKEAVLFDCATYSRGDTSEDHPACYWFEMPPKPESSAARAEAREFDSSAKRYLRAPEGRAMQERLDEMTAFADRP